MDDLRAEEERLDPLERLWRGRAVVLVAGLTVLLVFAVSAAGGAPSDLPGVALGSPALLHIERALLVGASIAGSFIFLIRGWAGYFPSKFSTTGAEYLARSSANNAIEQGDELAEAVAGMRRRHLALVESLRTDIRALEQRMSVLDAPGGTDDD